jgi:hypothetical protein
MGLMRARQRWARRTLAAERSGAAKDKADSAAGGDAKIKHKKTADLSERRFFRFSPLFHFRFCRRNDIQEMCKHHGVLF